MFQKSSKKIRPPLQEAGRGGKHPLAFTSAIPVAACGILPESPVEVKSFSFALRARVRRTREGTYRSGFALDSAASLDSFEGGNKGKFAEPTYTNTWNQNEPSKNGIGNLGKQCSEAGHPCNRLL